MLRTQSERISAAVRYRRDGDALRFICETHQELSSQPPPGRRTLVLFAHFDPQGIVDPYVVYYLKALQGLGATILFVSGSPMLTAEAVAPIRSLCAGIYTRRTLSLDFGSWHLAWCILGQRGWSLDQFDRFVIANDSVFGPLFPIEEMWREFHDADMYGVIENNEWVPHLQSFFLVWDLNSRTRGFLNDFWNDFQYIIAKPFVSGSTKSACLGVLVKRALASNRSSLRPLSKQLMDAHRRISGPTCSPADPSTTAFTFGTA